MKQSYGMNRVLEPQHVLPTSAWRLDNSRTIMPQEIRVDIKRIHVEGTSFKQICMESNDNDQRIKQKIMDIVIRRGKLHNPVTDTGGLFYGTVSEIGKAYDNSKGFRPGEEVVCNASLASVPIYINNIVSIDRAFGQIEVEGYAILYDEVPLVRKPEGVPINLLLFAFNESGTLYRVTNTAVGKKKFLIVGNNLLSNLLFGCAVRKVAREDAQVVCLLDKNTDMVLQGKSINELIAKVFNEVHYGDILKPMECLENLNARSAFDLSINCADIPGAETINILAAKSGGTVVFANLINNYNIALYITESISKQLDIRCADGYLEAYDQFDIEIIKDMIPYLENARLASRQMEDNPAYPINRKTRLMEASGQRKTMLDEFVCESRAMASVLDEVLTVAKYDCNVLITGDTGVGKSKIADIIHKNSNRKMHPFIKVNCASIAADDIEQVFFGREEPDADGEKRKGYFELADNGVLMLDEISGLQPDMQAKLLRVIQDGEFYRAGGAEPVKTNVRIVSSTERDLETVVEEGAFRRDLYYRLNVVSIKVPNLKERSGDIGALVEHFLRQYNEKFQIHRIMDPDAVEYLKQCDWPGNIRELENVVQRLMISAKGERITLLDVMRELHTEVFEGASMDFGALPDADGKVMDLEMMVDNFEKNIIRHACEKYGSTRKVAKAIGISQTQLVRKKKKYQI
ncbi:MAG: sigma-54-dependent Fis family transcriptional regulator [Firmicutes bacterium]|nr:sigma-54-dependent Fis family transcriptional regulator [Bacillota bacterium]